MEGDSPRSPLPREGEGSPGRGRDVSPLGRLPWEGLGGGGDGSSPGRLPWEGMSDAISRCCREELSREELAGSISELRQEVRYLLGDPPAAPAPPGARRAGTAPGGQPLAARALPRQRTLPALAESRHTGSRRASRSSSNSAANADRLPLFRRCACGCGEMVLTGGEEWDTIAPLGHRALSLQEVSTDATDARAQRASCERLARRRDRPPAAGAEAAPAEAEAAPRRPDFDRLRRMAQPRERAPEGPAKAAARRPRPREPPDAAGAAPGGRAGAGRAAEEDPEPAGSAPGSRAPSKGRAAAAPEPREASKEPAAAGATPSRPRPAGQAQADEAARPPEPALPGPPPPPPEAPAGHAGPLARRPPLSSSLSELPGMHQLLERRGTALRPLPPLAAAAPGFSLECLADEAYPRRRAQRTAQSQKRYTEARLHRPGGPAPGSAAALQLRLQALRAERLEREAAAAAVH